MRVFVSVGTHAQQFDRLLIELDKIAARKKIGVFGQIGNSKYEPKNFAFKRFLNEEELGQKIQWADIVVSHAGAGTIIHSMLRKKKLIIVPRLQRFAEHTNDHQLDLAAALAAEGKAIAVEEIGGLEKAIRGAANFFPSRASNKKELIKEIKTFLNKQLK